MKLSITLKKFLSKYIMIEKIFCGISDIDISQVQNHGGLCRRQNTCANCMKAILIKILQYLLKKL
ncbi:hypothetical protein CXT94_03355 [Akkermansia muciniphila]|nr:hypothetical protein CXT94_03355 [Akkermansia muciniphila]QHV08631.1 hypothetical protein C5N96_01925 [Akkermansia muciniphila]